MGVEWGSREARSLNRKVLVGTLVGSAAILALAFGDPDVEDTKTSPDILAPVTTTTTVPAPTTTSTALSVEATVIKAVAPAGATTTTTQCQEDEPCWDCETMGNRICGPINP